MALFFNLELLEREAANDPDKFLTLLSYHHYRSIPSNSKSKYKPLNKSLSGQSFLLNPNPILKNTATDKNFLVQYIKLAGRRDWLFYKLHGVKYLDISFYPEINLDKIKHNPLLTIETTLIKFKFEEIYNVIKIW